MKQNNPHSFLPHPCQHQGAADEAARGEALPQHENAEQQKLQALHAEYRNGAPERLPGERGDAGYRDRVARLQADLQRTENNIASLRRELTLLSRQ